MAARFWVTGGTGNWNSTTNWSATSGGASGASVPGSADTATLNANSGSGTVTLDISPTIQTLTCTGFTGTLAFGTNTISLNSTGTIFTGNTTMTVTGTPLIICTNSSATARTITATAVTEANSISFRITAGTGTLTLSTNSAVRDLDFTDGTNPTGFAGSLASNTASIFGSLKASTGMLATAGAQVLTFAATSGTKTINTAGVTFDRPLVFSGAGGTWQLQAALTSGSTRTCNLAIGTLDLNGYTLTTGLVTSSNSNVRTFAFGSTGKFVLTGTGATVWTTATATNLTVTGTNPLIQLTTAATTGTRGLSVGAAGEANAISVDVTAGSDTIGLVTTNGAFKNVVFTGFSGNLQLSNSPNIFGNLTLSTGMTVIPNTTQAFLFAATSGTQQITSNGKTIDYGVTLNGIGGTVSLQDALTLGSTRTLTLTNGTLTTNSYAVTAGAFSSSNTNTRTLNLGASTVTVTNAANATSPWNITDPTNMTLNAGTSTISMSTGAVNPTFAGGGLTYYNVTFPASYYNITMSGANTFNNLTLASPAGVGRRSLSFNANQTISGTLSCSGSAANSRPRLIGNTGGTTLTVAVVAALADIDFSNITAAGASSPWSGTRLGNFGLNTNITFATPKTVYWNQPAGGIWSDVAWATSSGGAVNINNFPLGQDTAVLDNTGVGASSTIVMDYGWVLPALSAGSLTNNLTINVNTFAGLTAGFAGPTVTLSSAITLVATNGPLAFNPLSNGTLTTAGVVFPMQTTLIGSLGVTMALADNFTCTGKVNLVAGTVDLNGKTLSCDNFDSTFGDLSPRSFAFNGGQINITGSNSTVWACEDLTNFSYTGTPTVNFTYSGSTGTRSVANGVIGLTEANAVDFNIVAGGDTWSSSGVPNGVRNWTFQPAFTGSASFYANGFIYGNVLLSPSQTVLSGAAGPTFAATSGTKTITTNGVTLDRPLTFNGVGGTWSLQSALTLGATNGNLAVSGGTLNTNNYNITAASFSGSGTSVRAINLGSSTITVSGSGTLAVDFSVPTNLTLNSGTSTFDLTNTSATKFFQGGGLTFYKVRISGNSQTNINGGNTRFQELSNTVTPLSITFGNLSNPIYFDNFLISGTAGNLVTLQSATPGTQFLLAKNTGGKVLVSYVSITDSAATPAGYWFAPTSQGNVNGGNNTGWNFSTAGGAGGFLPFF